MSDLEWPSLGFDTCQIDPSPCSGDFTPAPKTVDEALRDLLLETLVHTDWHMERTAASMGVSLKTVYNWRHKYLPTTSRARPRIAGSVACE